MVSQLDLPPPLCADPAFPGPGEAPVAYEAYERVERCDLCGDGDFADVDPWADVRACRNCGFRFVTPRPTQQAIARAYSRAEQYDSWLEVAADRERLWRRRYSDVASGLVPGRLLDVGAGLGTFLAIAREHGWAVSGTEVSVSAIRYAKEKYGLDLREGQLEQAIGEGPFDLITMWHVLEHVPEPAAALEICRRVLAPGGLLTVAVPNDGAADDLLSRAGRIARGLLGRPSPVRYARLVPGVETHISHYTPVTLRRRLEGSGFRVRSLDIDDAAPRRSRGGTAAFAVRRAISVATPWFVAREMLAMADVDPSRR